MRGDVVIVEAHHRDAAERIVERIADRIRDLDRPFVMSVAGESGSGKSEMGEALRNALGARDIRSVVFAQDDYFVLPPKSNDAKRREGIEWVGTGEVRIDLLDEHLAAVRAGATSIAKPVVTYAENRIDSEVMELGDAQVAIAEGTYTTLLDNVDLRIFISRNWLETLETRMRRGRERFDAFIERVLELEHEIISSHGPRADVVIAPDYSVSFGDEPVDGA